MTDATVIRKERTEFYVGLFVVAGLLIMGTLIWQFGKFSDRMESDYPVTLMLQDASGIIPGGNVMFAGERVGYVKSKQLDQENFRGIKVELRIFTRFNVPEGSRFRVATSGLMGDNFISITPPPAEEITGKVIGREGVLIEGAANALDQLPEQGKRIADDVEILLAELDAAVADVRKVVASFVSVSEKLDQKIMSEENLTSYELAIDNISETTKNLEVASAKLAPLLEESRKTVETAAEPFRRADQAIAKIEPALAEIDPAIRDLRATLKGMREATNQVTNGDGPVPALLGSSELRRDLESLIANLEEHGILGYKKGKAKDEAGEGEAPAEGSPDGEGERKPLLRGIFRPKSPEGEPPKPRTPGKPFGKN